METAALCVSVAVAVLPVSAGMLDSSAATVASAPWEDVVVGRFVIKIITAIIVAFCAACLLAANPAGSWERAVV